MGAIKKSLFIGGLVSAGLVWLTGTKKGKEVRDQILDASADIFLDAKKKLAKMDKKYHMSKNMFIKLAKETVNTYFEKSPMAETVKDVVLKTVISQWDHIKDVAEERVGETKRAVKKAVKKESKKK